MSILNSAPRVLYFIRSFRVYSMCIWPTFEIVYNILVGKCVQCVVMLCIIASYCDSSHCKHNNTTIDNVFTSHSPSGKLFSPQ